MDMVLLSLKNFIKLKEKNITVIFRFRLIYPTSYWNISSYYYQKTPKLYKTELILFPQSWLLLSCLLHWPAVPLPCLSESLEIVVCSRLPYMPCPLCIISLSYMSVSLLTKFTSRFTSWPSPTCWLHLSPWPLHSAVQRCKLDHAIWAAHLLARAGPYSLSPVTTSIQTHFLPPSRPCACTLSCQQPF